MTSSTFTREMASTNAVRRENFIQGIGFDRLMMVLCCCFVGGLFIDGWAHNHGLVDQTFFTPWHALLYSAFAANAVALLTVTFLNHRRGHGWFDSIPDGYALSLLGVPLFAVGGVGDLIWHTLFGFEVGIEPLLSPTHLVLALSGVFIMSGPLRAAMRRADPVSRQGWATLFPAIISLTATFSVSTFFTSFAHPMVQTWTLFDSINEGKALGAASILLQAGIMMGFVLLAIRRWKMPIGSFTLIFTLNAALMSLFKDQYLLIPVATLAGILVDLLYWWLKPSMSSVAALRLFAFIVPFVYYLSFFVSIMLYSGGISWTIHLWLGSTFMSGIIGMALSYLLIAPVGPATQVE
jgi:hypothetical protein